MMHHPPSVTDTLREVADQTGKRLEKNGYCLWKCKELGGEVIAIVKNKGFKPRNFKGVVYSIQDLVVACESDSIRLIHEARKEGAEIENE